MIIKFSSGLEYIYKWVYGIVVCVYNVMCRFLIEGNDEEGREDEELILEVSWEMGGFFYIIGGVMLLI